MAARSKVVDSIDLVSAVAPRVEGFVSSGPGDALEKLIINYFPRLTWILRTRVKPLLQKRRQTSLIMIIPP